MKAPVGGKKTDLFSGDVTGDERRSRMGLVLLVIGITLVIWAWGSWVYRTSEIEPDQSEAGILAEAEDRDLPLSDSTAPGWGTMILSLAAVTTLVVVAVVLARTRNRERVDRSGFPVPNGQTEDHTFSPGWR